MIDGLDRHWIRRVFIIIKRVSVTINWVPLRLSGT